MGWKGRNSFHYLQMAFLSMWQIPKSLKGNKNLELMSEFSNIVEYKINT